MIIDLKIALTTLLSVILLIGTASVLVNGRREVIEHFKDRFDSPGYGYSTGAIRVPPEKPVPEDLLVRII